MGGGSMQRTSNSTMRMAMALCLAALVLLTFLYLMKRVEMNKTFKELAIVKVETRNQEEGLNNKIVTYVEKIESLTQNVAIADGHAHKCQDEKALANKERDQLQRQQSETSKLLKEREAEKEKLEEELQDLKDENSELLTENQQCEADSEQMHSDVDDLKLKAGREATCSSDLRAAQSKARDLEREFAQTEQKLGNEETLTSSLRRQVKSLNIEKQSLQTELENLRKLLSESHPEVKPAVGGSSDRQNRVPHYPSNPIQQGDGTLEDLMAQLQDPGEAGDDALGQDKADEFANDELQVNQV